MPKAANREIVLAALLTNPTVRRAAEESKISEATLYLYLREPDFIKEYRAARRAILEQATARVQLGCERAVAALERNLVCDNSAAQVRAAQLLLDFAYRGLEQTDFLERLEAIEARFAEEKEK